MADGHHLYPALSRWHDDGDSAPGLVSVAFREFRRRLDASGAIAISNIDLLRNDLAFSARVCPADGIPAVDLRHGEAEAHEIASA